MPSAADNRPLKFEEFEEMINQILFVSATPGKYEMEHSSCFGEQIIRPTGLLDPVIEVRPIDGQIDDLLHEIQNTVQKNETLYSIAREYKVSPNKLLKLNPKLKDGKVLSGQKIQLLDDNPGKK